MTGLDLLILMIVQGITLSIAWHQQRQIKYLAKAISLHQELHITQGERIDIAKKNTNTNTQRINEIDSLVKTLDDSTEIHDKTLDTINEFFTELTGKIKATPENATDAPDSH